MRCLLVLLALVAGVAGVVCTDYLVPQNVQKAAFMMRHNYYRCIMGVPPRAVWSDVAGGMVGQAWTYSTRCSFVHSQPAERPNQGENLAAFPPFDGARVSWVGRVGDLVRAAVDLWASEKTKYTGGVFPSVCIDKTANGWTTCGHYTQIMWRNSNELGCALNECGIASAPEGYRQSWASLGAATWFLVVCRYRNAGNVIGQTVYENLDYPADFSSEMVGLLNHPTDVWCGKLCNGFLAGVAAIAMIGVVAVAIVVRRRRSAVLAAQYQLLEVETL